MRYFRVKNSSFASLNENIAQQRMLAIDGSWGLATTRRLQEVLFCRNKDGLISEQIRNPANQAIPSVQFGNGSSNMIRRLQALLSVPSDRNFEPVTCLALQKRMVTIQDGIISLESDCVKAMQNKLNKDQL